MGTAASGRNAGVQRPAGWPDGSVERSVEPKPVQVVEDAAQPMDETELYLGNIWKDILKISHVGRKQTFFELGGHSLLAVQLLARIKEQFDQDLPLSAIFEA